MTDRIRARLDQALSGTHSIERELVGGGMARVFVATERALGRRVVIKTLPDDGWSAASAQRFRREILTAAQLQHANIVPVLSAGDAEGMPYFTMPLVEGASLRDRLARGPVPLPEAIGILRDVARALGAAHARRVVHRDIKPENILLSADAALVTDFGVAKAISAATEGVESSAPMTATGVSVGTPVYMSPEQLAADPTLDHRTDLYAWGLVAYELLTGERPFAALSGTALIKAQLSTMPPALAEVAPQVPRALADLVMRCLEKEPAKRPQSASELLAALDLPSGESPARTAAGRSRRVGLIAASALGLLAAGWWILGRTDAAVDESTVAVAPFRVGGSSPDVHYLREGLGDIIVPQLQTIPDVRAAGMRVMLDRWQRIGGAVEADLDDAQAARAAREAGAGRFILGDVVGTRERMTVNARLLRVRDGRELARARIDGSADSVFTLATRLVTTLLSISDGASQERLRSVLSANPDAIAPYLVGEQFYRRGRYAEAGDAFLAAYQADTSFAIAALRVFLTNGWSLNAPIPGPWLDRAWTHRARLSGTDSLLLIASTGESYPAPMDVPSEIRLLESLARRSNSAELWYAYADHLAHNGESADEPDANAKALEGFRRAEALDSSFAPALEHQAFLHLVLGDTTNAIQAHARQARRDSTGDFFRINDFMMEKGFGDLDGQLRALRRIAASRRTEDMIYPALFSSTQFAGQRPRIDLADSALAMLAKAQTERLSPAADAGRRELHWNFGRAAAAAAIPAREDDLSGQIETVLAGVIWDADESQAASSARILDAALRARASSGSNVGRALMEFALAQRSLAQGDTARVEALHLSIRANAEAAQPAWAANNQRVLDAVLSAQLSVARRAPDARARVVALDTLLLVTPEIHRRLTRATGNLILATLWERLGEPDQVLRITGRRDGQTAYAMFNTERLRLIARAARVLNRPQLERAALQEFLDMRASADAHLQPEVERFRARVAELNASAAR